MHFRIDAFQYLTAHFHFQEIVPLIIAFKVDRLKITADLSKAYENIFKWIQ